MKLKSSLTMASVAAALGLGLAGQAQASVYAHSLLQIRNLSINITGVNFPNVNTLSFDLQNTAN